MTTQQDQVGVDRAAPADWEALYRRLAQARTPYAQDPAATPAQVAAILAARAAQLAQAPPDTGPARSTLDILEFQLAHEAYGIASSLVQEVYPLKELTPLPGTPPFVRGIMSVRGQIFSVIDLRFFLDLPERDATLPLRTIIVQAAAMRFAILADAIVGMRALPLDELGPVPPTLTGRRGAYLQGVTGDRLILLDAEKLLADETLIVNDEPDS